METFLLQGTWRSFFHYFWHFWNSSEKIAFLYVIRTIDTSVHECVTWLQNKKVSTSWSFPHLFPERCQGVAWFPAWKTAQYDGDFLLCCVLCVQSELFYLGAILENSLREDTFSPTFPPWHIFWPSCLCLCSYIVCWMKDLWASFKRPSREICEIQFHCPEFLNIWNS